MSWIKRKSPHRDDQLLRRHRPGRRTRQPRSENIKTGASKIYIDNLQGRILRAHFILSRCNPQPFTRANIFSARDINVPLIAKRIVEIAKKEKADAIAHGATGKGNDQVRFELTAAALAPDLQVIAPRGATNVIASVPVRQEMIDYCAKHKIPVQAQSKSQLYSMDRNLLHISYEAGILEGPWF